MPTPLPVRIWPEPGETFPSLVERIAQATETSPGWVLDASGMDLAGLGKVKVGLYYGIALPAPDIEVFARFARLPREAVAGTLLTDLAGTCLGFGGLDPDDLTGLERIVQTEWAVWIGTNYCPECLGQGGVWQLGWKVPWTFACEEHGTLLRSSCSRCGRTPDHGTRKKNEEVVARLGRCREPIPQGKGGRASATCDQDLSQCPAEPLSHEVLGVQRRFQIALNAGSRANGAPAAFFDDHRFVVRLLVSGAADVRMFPAPTDKVAGEALGRFVRDRQQMIREPGGIRRFAALYRQRRPSDPALMAAVLPFALDIVSHPSSERSRDALARFASATRCELSFASLRTLTMHPMSDRLRNEVTAAVEMAQRRYVRSQTRPRQLLGRNFAGSTLPDPTEAPQDFSRPRPDRVYRPVGSA